MIDNIIIGTVFLIVAVVVLLGLFGSYIYLEDVIIGGL